VRTLILTLLGALALALPSAAPAAARKAHRQVPQGFLGVVADGPLLAASTNVEAELDAMVAAGVEAVRVVVNWADAQPYPTAADVPEDQRQRFTARGGVPTDLVAVERLVAGAAARGLDVLAVVYDAPVWAGASPGRLATVPADPAAFGRFLTQLVARYGPRGSLWPERPGLRRAPVRAWQIWTQPDIETYWSIQPWEPSYVAQLQAARDAIKAADSGARVILGGLSKEDAAQDLEAIYAAGGRGAFDAAAIHPYADRPADVLAVLRKARAVMAKHGDGRVPLLATEYGWNSGLDVAPLTTGFDTNERGQAANLAQVAKLLARDRKKLGLERIFWASWLSPPTGSPYGYNYTGLRRQSGGGVASKPALTAFKRTALKLEACRRKAKLATRCR